MKRAPSISQEGSTLTKRRRHLSCSEDEEPKYTPSVLRQLTDPPMSKIYNSSFRNNKPAELFRKDLISAMKIADSEQLMPEDYWTMVDTWRQEWEKGVQVPVNPDGLPRSTFRKVSKSKQGDFKLPKKLIRCTHDEFFSNDFHVLTNVMAQSEKVCRYDLDDLDCKWLQLLNDERDDLGLPPILESDMELILEEFESQCANSLQEAIKNEEGLGIEFDEDVICDVCRSPDSEDSNEMVFCDSCNICVHQACYGITTIPEGSWVCRTCALGIRPPCVLCPNRGGAMKSTRSGQKWAHVSCALWVPEVSIGCVDKMEPITKIGHIPASRWALVCSICRERSGACIQCSVKTCKTAYHITCAFKDGLEMKAIIDEENEEDGVKLRSFCEKHSKKKNYDYTSDSECEAPPRKSERGRRELEMSSEEKAGVRAQRIQVLEADFYCYINTKDTSDLLQMDTSTVDFVFQYWKLKRKANFNKALLTRRAEESDLLVKQQEDSLYARMKMFVHLRQDLERVRNLCYMVNRREKLSRSFFKIREDVFRKQAALMNARGNPKLTEKEREAVLQANRGENIYDRLYTTDQAKVPSLQAVVSILEGKDGQSLDLYSPRKTPKKSPELQRLPNPYAKHYLNGIRRSHRRFASLFKFEDSPSWTHTSPNLEDSGLSEMSSVAGGEDQMAKEVGEFNARRKLNLGSPEDKITSENLESDGANVGRVVRKPSSKTSESDGKSTKKNANLEAQVSNAFNEIVEFNGLSIGRSVKKPSCDFVDSKVAPIGRNTRKNVNIFPRDESKAFAEIRTEFSSANVGKTGRKVSDDILEPDRTSINNDAVLSVEEDGENTYKRYSVKEGTAKVSRHEDSSVARRLRSGDKISTDSENLSPAEESKSGSLGGASQRGPLSGYKIPKRVRTEECSERGHLPISPLSNVAQSEAYQKPRYNMERAPTSPRLVIKLRKDPDSQERWHSDNRSRFQVVRNDWSQHRRSERQRKTSFVYDDKNRYRFRTALHRSEFFS